MARAYLPLAFRWNPPSSQRGSLGSHILVLLLGSALGIAMMWYSANAGWWVPRGNPLADAAAASGSLPDADSAARRPTGPLPSVLEVNIAYAEQAPVRLPAITVALADGGVGIVTYLEALLDATGARLPLGSGRALRLREVLAVAPEARLVMLGPGDQDVEGVLQGLVSAPPADATLHLGRPVSLLAYGGYRGEGFVDSPAQRSELGAYWYALSAASSSLVTPAAIVDGQNRLLGMAVRSPIGGEPKAGLDLQALRPLLLAEPGLAREFEAFVDTFFAEDDIGRLLTVERAAQAGDWTSVIAGGSDLMYLSYPIADRVRPLLEEAFQVRIADALSRRNAGERSAQSLLDQAADLLGWSAPRRVLAARLARSQGDISQALAQLNRAQQEAQADPPTQRTLRDATRTLLGDVLASGQLSVVDALALLQAQLQSDPDHAAYHASLGRLLFEQGRYRESLAPLYRARALDGQRYGDEFASLIALAQERLYAPGVTVVPVLNQGATLFVNGTIPGTSGTYRFILDTGASITAISPRVAAQLPGLVSRGSVRLSTANGEVQAPLITLPSLDIAGARVAELDVVVLDSLASYDGLLGLSFLDHFNMELDRNRNEMTLTLR